MNMIVKNRDVYSPRVIPNNGEPNTRGGELLYDKNYHLGIIHKKDDGSTVFESASLQNSKRIDTIENTMKSMADLKILLSLFTLFGIVTILFIGILSNNHTKVTEELISKYEATIDSLKSERRYECPLSSIFHK